MQKLCEKVNLDRLARVIVMITADTVLITFSLIAATWMLFSGEGYTYAFPFYINGMMAF